MATRKTLGFRKNATGSAAFDKLSVGATFPDPEVDDTSMEMTGNLALRLPLLTEAKRTSITPSAANVGMMVYDTTNLGIFTSNGSEWVEAGADVNNRGTVTADPNPAEAGVYTLDSSGGAFNFTLPAATGSQAEVTIISGNVPNDEAVTVRVQTGEALNGTTNGTLVIRESGLLYTAIDRSTGNWDIFTSTKATDLQPVALPDPLIVAHRGLPYQEQEHSMAGFKKVMEQGINVLEFDIQFTKDGKLVSCHDTTINNQFTSTGNVADFTQFGWQKLKYANTNVQKNVTTYLNAETEYGALFEDFLKEFGTKAFYIVEAKGAGDTLGEAIVELLKEYNLTNRAVIQDFNQTRLDNLMATYKDQNLGLRFMFVNSSISGADAAAKGYDFVGHNTSVSEAFVQDLVNNGVPPIVYTLLTRREWAIWQGYGSAGCWADDAPWIAEITPVYTSDPFHNLDWYNGNWETRQGVGAGQSPFIDSNGHLYITRPDGASQGSMNLQGWGCPIANAASTYTITAVFELDTLNPDGNSSVQMGICSPNDDFEVVATSYCDAYNILARSNGTLEIFLIEGGVATSLDSDPGSTLTTGTEYTLVATVTPTSITCTMGAQSVTTNDTTFRGPYFFLGGNFRSNNWDFKFKSVVIS